MWEDADQASRRMLSTTPLNSVDASANMTHDAYVHNILHRQFLYRLSGAGTLQGWVRAMMKARTRTGTGINELAQDMISQLVIRVVSADGASERGVALATFNPLSSGGQTKWPQWDFFTRKFPSLGRWGHSQFGAAMHPVNYVDGDWLVFEVGSRNFTGDNEPTGAHTWYNDKASSDLGEAEHVSTNLRSWIEFSPPSPAYEMLLGQCAAGHVACPWHAETDPVNTATGNYVSSVTDLALPGRGLPFTFTRTYNSLAANTVATAPNLVRFPIGGATASYSASSFYSADYAPHDAADGITGNSTAAKMSWALNGWTAGSLWQVSWSSAQALNRIVLCDRRANEVYFGSSGRITFSDGSTVNWSGLPNDCGATGTNPLTISFPRKTNITWFRVISDAGGIGNSGFAEVDAFDDAITYRPLGPGWTHAYAARLQLETGGAVRFTSEDGAQIVYWPDPAGAYTTPNGAFSTLAKLGDGTYELTRRDQVRYRFDAAGFLTAMLDRNGNQLSFAYTNGRLTSVTDTVGRSLSLTYHPNGRLATLSGPPSRTVSYAYDASGRLSTVTDARGKVWAYTYDTSNRLLTLVDPLNHTVVTNEYGSDGRVSAQTDARGKRGTFAWDPATEISTYTDARGKVWIDDYERGRLVRQRDPLGNETLYAYDADFNVTSVTDPRGKTTAQTWDAAGNLLSRTVPAPLSYVETWTYNVRNDPATYTDGRSNTTTYSYDPAGNLVTITEPLTAVTEFGRDPAGTGLLVTVTDPRDKTTTYEYDTQANLTSVTTPLGNEMSMTHDDAGRLLTVVDPRGNEPGAIPGDYTSTLTYDAADHLLTATDPLAHLTSRTFDDAGNLASLTDPNSHATTYAYDAANHLASVTDAGGEVTAYTYDDVGSLVSRTDANDHVTAYTYDDASRLATTTDPLNNVWSLTYDAAGNVATRTDAKAKTTTYSWDALNRLTGITYADAPTPAVTFAYDANSNRTTMTDGAGTETATFDALNRLTAVTRGSDTFSYGHDPAGNVTSRTYPGQAAQTWTYDDDGRLATANGATHGYDAAGHILTVATPDGLTARSTWDRAGRLLEVAHTGATDTLSRFTYALDSAGNRTATTSREGTVTYRYDVLDRLTEACWSTSTCPGGTPAVPLACLACVGSLATRPAASVTPPPGETFRTYTYDPVGNRLTEGSNAGSTTYAYDAADRLASLTPPGQAAITCSFDNNGNQTAAGADSFAWDLADRMVSATVSGLTETYTWAGDGRRLSATTGGGTTTFLWDQAFVLSQLVLERDGAGATLRSYGYGTDLLSQTTGSSTAWYHHDGLGSVTDLADASGASLAWTEFYAFGQIRQASFGPGAPAVQPFAFAGEQRDAAAGLYHLRARQYDPSTGRFLSTDPLAQRVRDHYVGTYVYVRNNPCNLVDPRGLAGEPVADDNFDLFGWFDPEAEVLGCKAGELGLGIGLIFAGAWLEVGGGFAEVASAGALTPFAIASVLAGAGDIAAGQSLVRGACSPQ